MSTDRYRILLVDDSPDDRETWTRLLVEAGRGSFEVVEAATGEEGLGLALDLRPDCVLLDYRLPDLDGLEFLDRIRSEFGHLLLPVVMLTGQGNEEVAVRAMKAGAQDYVVKDAVCGEELAHTIIDAVARQAMELSLRQVAFHDPLTGLPNRRILNDRLEHLIRRAHRYPSDRFAVLFVDLDDFKRVNDQQGHLAGDAVLVAVARRMEAQVRASDTVVRLGGDEFVILLEHVADPKEARDVARRVLRAIEEPVAWEKGELRVSASIGVLLGDSVYEKVEDIIEVADGAMYRAKHAGKSQVFLVEGDPRQIEAERRAMQEALARSLENEDLRMFYQPLRDLQTGAVRAVEALVRWNRPDKGVVSAATFLPMAQGLHLETAIADWAIETALSEAAGWTGADGRQMRLVVNLDRHQFRRPDLLDWLAGVAREVGFPLEALELDVEEEVLFEDLPYTIRALDRMREAGLGVTIQGFGTGTISLRYLERFAVTGVKINAGLLRVEGVHSSPGDPPLFRALTGIGSAFGLALKASHVESEEQAEHLRRQGCVEAQGFLLGRPVPAEELQRVLA